MTHNPAGSPHRITPVLWHGEPRLEQGEVLCKGVSLEGAVTITVRRRPKLPELKAEPTA